MEIINFYQYFIYPIISFVIIYFTGNYTLELLKIKTKISSFNFFLKILLGVIIVVTFYSLFKTNGKSIYYITLILLLSIYFLNKNKEIEPISIIEKKKIYFITAFSILSISYIIMYYFYVIKSNLAVFGDNHFYSLLAHNLNTYGIETTDYVDWTKIGFTNSYHYTEQWFTAFFAKIYNINTLHTYYFIYTPIFITLMFFGALSIFEFINHKRYNLTLGIITSFLFLFIQIFDNPFSSKTLFENFFYVGYPLFNIKYVIVYAIFITSIIFLKLKKYNNALLIILFIVPLYPVIIPSLLTGLFILFLYLFILKKINFKKLIKYLSIIVLTFLMYVFFYYFQEKVPNNPWNNEMWEQFYDSIYKISKIFIVLIVGLIGFLIVYFYTIKKIKTNNQIKKFHYYFNNYTLINSAFIFVVSGCLIVFIIFPYVNTISHNSFQLLSIFIIPIYTIFVYLIILLFIRKKNNFQKYFIVISFFIYFILLTIKNPSYSLNMYKHPYLEIDCDEEYYKNIKKTIIKDSNPKFAFYRIFDKEMAFYLNTYLFMPDSRILHYKNNYMPLCLNPDEMPIDIDYRFGDKNEHAFYRFYLKEKDKKSKELITLNFLKKHQINYIILENNYLCPEYLEPFIVQKFKNKYNNNIFLKIKI